LSIWIPSSIDRIPCPARRAEDVRRLSATAHADEPQGFRSGSTNNPIGRERGSHSPSFDPRRVRAMQAGQKYTGRSANCVGDHRALQVPGQGRCGWPPSGWGSQPAQDRRRHRCRSAQCDPFSGRPGPVGGHGEGPTRSSAIGAIKSPIRILRPRGSRCLMCPRGQSGFSVLPPIVRP
jgi:hypothetical protein